ncbi:MAG: RnfABCDGE type electron transport complex subunit D [Flavobacteriales bacterium]|nr:RnfABCDGE type electron transport complex subunit D [Flavobacteriales bacterium]MBP6573239.1 RnfABCDGE type electron transport complex subunit D [Flavobacteriales bacterium]
MSLSNALDRTWKWFLSDGRHFQIVFLSCFLCYGIFQLQWDAEASRYAIIATTCLGTQAVFIFANGLERRTLKSAAITTLGLCLLLKSGSTITLVLGAFVAIASKFVLRVKGKHIFNPANIGIVAAMLLTGDGWVSPGQWGSGAALVFLVGSAGLMVVLRVGRIDTSIAFLLAFAALHFARNVLYLGWGVDVWLHQLTNGSLLLFTFFMITDPVTTPSAPRARVGWSIAIAVLAFLLGWKYFVNAAPVWALFFISASTPLVDLIWKGERFRWVGQGTTTIGTSTTART